MAADKASVRWCIAGGGAAGIMLGLLLARAGVDVLGLEKHADLLRDFRGDTIHPSTLEVMHELGLLEDLLKLPHQKAPRLNAQVGELALTIADFTYLPTHCGFIAFMPQWDFLNFLAERGACYPTFKLRMRAEVTGLLEDAGQVVGLQATTPDGPLEVRASLVVGADGRHSVVRARAGLQVDEFGAPMDVLWFRLSRPPLHRRCGARDVPGRRRGHQPRDPGRGRRRESAGRAAARGPAHNRGPAPGAAAARATDASHPAGAALGPEPGHQARPGRRRWHAHAAARCPAPRALPVPAPDTRSADWDRVPSRACENARHVKEKRRRRGQFPRIVDGSSNLT